MARLKRKHASTNEAESKKDGTQKETEESDAVTLNIQYPLDAKDEADDSSSDESSVYSELEEEPDDSDEEADDSGEGTSSENAEETEELATSNGGTSISATKSAMLGPVAQVNEYEYDSSDEEDLRNTVGNIPMEWYDEFPHIGYDWDGNKIMKPATKDELDKFLSKMEDSNYWRTVKDKLTGQDVILADEDIDIIHRIQMGRYPDKNYNPYKAWADIYSHEVEVHPINNRPEHKRSFVPSRIEAMKVAKMVHAIKMGWIQPRKQKEEKPPYYMLWNENDKSEMSRRMALHMPAPKLKLPGHEESYNPPPEYLFTKEEEEKWLAQEPEERRIKFLPKKYSCLRAVPAYADFIKERFERCLDLYLCPRQRKIKMNIDPDDLIPKLPKAKDLQPFPTTLSLMYKGHTGPVRCISVDHSGQYLVSGSDDKTIRFWEVSTRRCLFTMSVSGGVKSLAWCPNVNICVVAAVVDNNVLIINPGLADKLIVSTTDEALNAPVDGEPGSKNSVKWIAADEKDWDKRVRFVIEHPKEIKQVTWHTKGDYFATIMTQAANASIQVHQLTKRQSKQLLAKFKGLAQCALFHPHLAYFFVATQRFIRRYDLIKQEMKKLTSNCNWISSMAIHPGGDNIITGSYDPRLSWFDMDLSTKPYKSLRHHKDAIRQVAFHKRFPLFASASDDGSVIVCHGEVYNDLLMNPLIVPVKVLRGHKKTDDLGVLDCQFHPNSPWIFSAGADGNICLFT